MWLNSELVQNRKVCSRSSSHVVWSGVLLAGRVGRVGGVCSRVTLWVAFFRMDFSWRGGWCGWIGAWRIVGFVAVLFRGCVGV